VQGVLDRKHGVGNIVRSKRLKYVAKGHAGMRVDFLLNKLLRCSLTESAEFALKSYWISLLRWHGIEFFGRTFESWE
jgi:hypothetical protein